MTEPSKTGLAHSVLRVPSGFVAGATYPLQAALLLARSPALWSFVAVPVLVNLILGVVLYLGLLFPAWGAIAAWTGGLPIRLANWVAGLPPWAARILGWLPTGASFVDEVLSGLLAIVLLVLTGLLLVQFGAILGAPWYGSLAERIEQLRLKQLPPTEPQTVTRALYDIWRALTFQVKKLLLAGAIGIPLFLLNLVPGIGSAIASVGGIALAALLVGLDFFDPPLERRRFSFRTKL
ncbi:EI24 domain-containing protein, partial [Leptolyngbya sp. FACHB-36]|uniref:EI24 domain-containing protein n=1 Tax=Leptolyngbya sp. FACHB-36 TaxID=2692808 RepID=UPI001680DDAF